MKQIERFKSIELLKFLAIIMIILVHYEQMFDINKAFWYFQMGCPVFFVCSGFGIACLFNKKYSNKINKQNIFQFYVSRFKSIAPAWYFTFILIFIINSILILCNQSMLVIGTNRDPLSIFINLIFLNGLVPFCNNNVMPGGWFVGAIVILYLLSPLFIYLFEKLKNRYVAFFLLSFVFISIYILLERFCPTYIYAGSGFNYFIFFVHVPSYLLGILLYKQRSLNYMYIYASFSFFCLGLSIFCFYRGNFYLSHLISSWLMALFTYFFLRLLIKFENKFLKFKIFNPISIVGKSTLYIYLLHAFFAYTFVDLLDRMFRIFGISIKNVTGFVLIMPIVILMSIFCGLLFSLFLKKTSYLGKYCLERKLIEYKRVIK